MKRLPYILLLFMALVAGCAQRERPEVAATLHGAEHLLDADADSAARLLARLPAPDSLTRPEVARWCMLQGQLADTFLSRPLPAFRHYRRAAQWYAAHGTPDEQARILLYLGRAYLEDGDYERAMTAYAQALAVAEQHGLHNRAGYIHSYMADMYAERAMWNEAIGKYRTAAECFQKARNLKSYAYALRDMGREYALMDSLPKALEILFKADSVADMVGDEEQKGSMNNYIGNVYRRMGEYEEAKKYLFKALKVEHDTVPTVFAIAELYLEIDSIQKAKDLLANLSPHNFEEVYGTKLLYYELYKRERKFDLALDNLEEYKYLTDSLIVAENKAKTLNIERKYNDQMRLDEINSLKYSRNIYIVISIACVLGITIFILLALLYRKRVKEKSQAQQIVLDNIKNELLNQALELERQRAQLLTLKGESEEYHRQKGKIVELALACRKLQYKLTVSSPVYKELANLAHQNKYSIGKVLLTERHWVRLESEIITIYPSLKSYIFNSCPEMSEQEWHYCCFFMYGFDVNTEARLLDINPGSVRTKHLRLKEKLKITLPPKTSLHEYLVGELL